jgi:hypothetical protein
VHPLAWRGTARLRPPVSSPHSSLFPHFAAHLPCRSTTAARSVVKDAVKAKYDAKEQFHFIRQKWNAGKVEPKATVSNIAH